MKSTGALWESNECSLPPLIWIKYGPLMHNGLIIFLALDIEIMLSILLSELHRKSKESLKNINLWAIILQQLSKLKFFTLFLKILGCRENFQNSCKFPKFAADFSEVLQKFFQIHFELHILV